MRKIAIAENKVGARKEINMGGDAQNKVDWAKLKEEIAPFPRGLLAAPLSEEEQKARRYQSNRQGIVDAIRIIVETLPFVHPDWLLEEIGQVGEPDLVNIARLQFINMAVTSLDQAARLRSLLIASEEKNLADQGIEAPKLEAFTLNTLLNTLAERVSPPPGKR